MEKLFDPDKVAVVGASRDEGKTGHEIFDNLLHSFDGETVPVNPRADEIHGYTAEDSIPDGTDLAVIAVPASIVPEVMDDAASKDVEAAIVVTAGFSEAGDQELESEMMEVAEDNDITLLGPNVLGLINTENGLNASFATKMPYRGNINFMSQSGAFCTAILDYSESENIGFRNFVSIGNKAMIGEKELLEEWKDDGSEVILGYTEGIENGRKFVKTARRVSQSKPVLMLKAGKSDEGSRAASSHTGSIAGSYQAYQAAFRKSGVIEVESARELLGTGKAFSWQTLPEGENIAVVSNAGGPGVVISDEIDARGMSLASFEPDTQRKLGDFLPDEAEVSNPLDLIGDAGHERYRKALEEVKDDENVDAVIAVLTPQANTEIEKTARTVAEISAETHKPVLASFMGSSDVREGSRELEERGVPDFEDPVDAIRALESMKEYREFLEKGETLVNLDYNKKKADEVLDGFHGYMDAEELLRAYGIDTAFTREASSPREAEDAANDVGFPAVMKINSPDISHKTDVGGVVTGLESRDEVNEAFEKLTDELYHQRPDAEMDGVLLQEELEGLEVVLGLNHDPQFGPVVMVGLGGIFVEALHDVSFGLPPVTEEEAENMIEELRSHELFRGARGRDYSMEPVKDAIMKLGELGMHHPEIGSLDINPFVLTETGGYAADIEIEFRE